MRKCATHRAGSGALISVIIRAGLRRRRYRVTHKLLLASILVLVFLVGGSIGFGLGNKYGMARVVPVTDFGTAMYAGVKASEERLHGTDATYENSLRGYLTLLDKLTARDASASSRQIYATDKALSLIRLADLAEKRGSSAESTRLTADALAVCSTVGLPYCSSVELRQRAQQMDAAFEPGTQAR